MLCLNLSLRQRILFDETKVATLMRTGGEMTTFSALESAIDVRRSKKVIMDIGVFV